MIIKFLKFNFFCNISKNIPILAEVMNELINKIIEM